MLRFYCVKSYCVNQSLLHKNHHAERPQSAAPTAPLKHSENSPNIYFHLLPALALSLSLLGFGFPHQAEAQSLPTTQEVNRANKTSFLPKEEWGQPKSGQQNKGGLLQRIFSLDKNALDKIDAANAKSSSFARSSAGAIKTAQPRPPGIESGRMNADGQVKPRRQAQPAKQAQPTRQAQPAVLNRPALNTGSLNSNNIQQRQRSALDTARVRQNNNLALAPLFAALTDLQSGARQAPITILHIGDDHIATDRLSSALRKLFQTRFGDAGRGFVLPGYAFPYYRADKLRFGKQGKWAASNIIKQPKGIYNLAGAALTTRQKGAELSLQTRQFDWAEVSILRANTNGDLLAEIINQQEGYAPLVAEKRLIAGRSPSGKTSIARLRFDQSGQSLRLTSISEKPVTILSWAVGMNKPGIRYINIGWPGARADHLRNWRRNIIQADLKHLRPNLIIFSFGTNEALDDSLDTKRYSNDLARIMQEIKQAAPDATLLVTSPFDAARMPAYAKRLPNTASTAPCRALTASERKTYLSDLKNNAPHLARWHPPLKMQGVRHALMNAALTHKAFYWDWSKDMGGACGIHAWAHANPPLASKNHIHLTDAGAAQAAKNLFDAMMARLAGFRRSAESKPAPNKLTSSSKIMRK